MEQRVLASLLVLLCGLRDPACQLPSARSPCQQSSVKISHTTHILIHPPRLLSSLHWPVLRRRTSHRASQPNRNPPNERLRLLLSSSAIPSIASHSFAQILPQTEDWTSRRTDRGVCRPQSTDALGVDPSVFQHIGSRSTKWRGNGSEENGEHDGLTGPERIWNFHFEGWDSERLSVERSGERTRL